MIRALLAIHFFGATAEMRNAATPAAANDLVHEGNGVVSLGTTFQTVEMDNDRRCRIQVFVSGPVHIDEVIIGRFPTFASIVDFGT
jgi:hypothetical protein